MPASIAVASIPPPPRHIAPLAEMNLLSLILTQGSFGGSVLDRCDARQITPAFFGVAAYQRVFEVIYRLRREKRCGSVDIAMVYLEATSMGIQITEAVMNQIEDARVQPDAEEYLIDTVCEMHQLRSLRYHLTKYQARLGEPVESVPALIDSFMDETFRMKELSAGISTFSAADSMKAAEPILANLMRGGPKGVCTGLEPLDQVLNGLAGGQLVVIAARPSIGKTALALNIADYISTHPAYEGAPTDVLFFSLETKKEQMTIRLMTSKSKVPLARIQAGLGAHAQIEAAKEKVRRMPLTFCDEFSVTASQIGGVARTHHAKRRLGAIIVDYLQLVNFVGDPRTPREQVVAQASRTFKGIATNLNLPVIVLSQLNRVSERDERRPRLSDLRESGAIEQDADVVLLLSRKTVDLGDTRDVITVDVAKNRDGACREVLLAFEKDIYHFRSCTDEEAGMAKDF